jgi:hypothetical protein
MKELYIEGLANHNDHESCAGNRKGTGEALTVAHTGRAIEPRNRQCRVRTLSWQAERKTGHIENARYVGP